MADLARYPGVFQQLRLVAGLRWLILKNGLRRKNNRWDLVGMIWLVFFGAAVTLGLSFAFYVAAYQFVETNRLAWFAILYWAIFLWWQVLPVFVAGFGGNFEFATLLRFPLSRRAFYLLGLGYGLSDFGALSSICWILSIIAGAASSRLGIAPVLLLVSAAFVLLNVTLERLIGSWLEKILARRRTRELFMGLFVLSMVSLNFLNPILQRSSHGARLKFLAILPYISWFPGSLAGKAIQAASAGDSRGYALGMAGLLAWAFVLTLLLWRRFAALYAGEEISESAAPAILIKRQKRLVAQTERPGIISPQVAVIAQKEFRYLRRNGFAFLSLVLPPVMVLFFSLQFGPGSMLKQHSIKPELFFPGIMAYLILILLSPAYNSFAYEGKGIQTYFMAPIGFREVLLGKNLFLVCLVGVELVLSLSLLTLLVGWPGTPMFLATIAAGAFAVTGQLAIANWSSLSFPKKMEIGRMKGQRNSAVAVWTAFGVQILIISICSAILLAGHWFGNVWIAPVAFGLLTAASLGGYVASLPALDRLAEDKKELLMETLTR